MIVWIYLSVSLLTIIVYAWDKAAARHQQQRISEKTLHLLAFIGGWPGAIIAQLLFHHKSKKHSFQIVFWIITLLNGLLFGYLVFFDRIYK